MKKSTNNKNHVEALNLSHPRMIWRTEVHCRIRSLDSEQQIAAQLWCSAILRLVLISLIDDEWRIIGPADDSPTLIDTTNEADGALSTQWTEKTD